MTLIFDPLAKREYEDAFEYFEAHGHREPDYWLNRA